MGSDPNHELLARDPEYSQWLQNLKQRVHLTQQKAMVSFNQELLLFYWELGCDIVEKQAHTRWGTHFLKQLSNDLMTAFPGIKGFSKRNLEYIRKWFLFYASHPSLCEEPAIAQQAVAQLKNSPIVSILSVPWGHNIALVTKCSSVDEALFYVGKTIVHGWSRNVLYHQIESNLWKREGEAISNFEQKLPHPQSDVAQQILKGCLQCIPTSKKSKSRDWFP